MARTIFCGAAWLLLSFAGLHAAPAQTLDSDFQQSVKAYQQSPNPDTAEKTIKLAVALPQLPPIPEEARRHFVRGVELFKNAKSPDDMEQVFSEFLQATRLAPWWPEARYNWALALEASGNYISAINNLKLYRLFKVSDADLRDAQDRIYEIEAKQEKASHEAAQAPESAPRQAVPMGKMRFSYDMRAGPFVRTVSGTVEDVQGLWNALLPLQPPPGAHGGYGMVGDDKLLGHEPGYGLIQLGMIARRYIKFDSLHVEQPSGWESIGVQSGVFTKTKQMNDATLGWVLFDLRPNFESDMKKLASARQ